MSRDPLFSDDRPIERAARDPQALSGLVRLQRLKFATGALALTLLAAIWVFWRFG